ncbi:MAG: SPOR domain-containing protein [Desulfobacteraceae bacterium]|nr:SPOR domain-containing protein [Desulfobacteraceae bacterium]
MLCFAVLPWWQEIAGINALAVPVAAILIVCFWGFGWIMNRLGTYFVRQHVQEAAVWERAGMMTEAKMAFERAAASYDSYWLSPLTRKKLLNNFKARLVRFYLAQPKLLQKARVLICDYLCHTNPADETVAKSWLEQICKIDSCIRLEHETVAHVAEYFRKNKTIQRLALSFFLKHRRSDFDALQTYHQAWQFELIDNDDILLAAKLLQDEGWINDWSLQIYLKAMQLGDNMCLAAVAAAVKWLPPTKQNRQALAQAAQITAQITEEQSRQLVAGFEPAETINEKPAARKEQKKKKTLSRTAEYIPPLAASFKNIGLRGLNHQKRIFHRLYIVWHQSPVFRKSIAGTGIALMLVIMTAVGLRSIKSKDDESATDNSPVAETGAPADSVANDPFTIQVAAYLNYEDAESYVDQLKKKDLDAFLTQVISANRKWYQVKISHFASKISAQNYGDQLKSKGLINDFYVAIYNSAD